MEDTDVNARPRSRRETQREVLAYVRAPVGDALNDREQLPVTMNRNRFDGVAPEDRDERGPGRHS
jgi:hypothetical protein